MAHANIFEYEFDNASSNKLSLSESKSYGETAFVIQRKPAVKSLNGLTGIWPLLMTRPFMS